LFAEFYSGSDSFPMGGRNIQFSTLVYNPVSARFENPRSLTASDTPVCRDVKITQGIPASLLVNSLNNQMWYHYRCECRSGSLWLFESRIKQRNSTFGYDTTYLLLRLVAKAPALKATYQLPRHDEANINTLEFTLNARRVRGIEDLTPDEKNAFKKFAGETSDQIVEFSQRESELSGWTFLQLEPAEKKSLSLVKGRNRPVAINRVRRIRK